MNKRTKKKNTIRILFFAFADFLTGCASVNGNMHQNVFVNTLHDTSKNTECRLKNEEGEYSGKAGGYISIHTDGNNLDVSCENETQIGKTSIEPDFRYDYLMINIILIDACIISCWIDGINNAFYYYKSNIYVSMEPK
jgi:hypothetical protein